MVQLNLSNKVAIAIAMASSVISQAIPSDSAQNKTMVGLPPLAESTPLAIVPRVVGFESLLEHPRSEDEIYVKYMSVPSPDDDEVEDSVEDANTSLGGQIDFEFSEIIAYAESIVNGNVTSESTLWANLGAAVLDTADLFYGREVFQAYNSNAEKFSDFVFTSDFERDIYANALNEAFLKWKEAGSPGPIPTVKQVIASIPSEESTRAI